MSSPGRGLGGRGGESRQGSDRNVENSVEISLSFESRLLAGPRSQAWEEEINAMNNRKLLEILKTKHSQELEFQIHQRYATTD